MFDQNEANEPRNNLRDWVLRGGIAFAFVLFGVDKFPSGPGAPWVAFFAQIGIGQWFRYCTGIVEIVGALLLLIPRTVTAGLVLLACTMAGAFLIHIFVMGHPANAIITGAFLGGLVVFWLTRHDR
jgi:putative oxidoreductase